MLASQREDRNKKKEYVFQTKTMSWNYFLCYIMTVDIYGSYTRATLTFKKKLYDNYTMHVTKRQDKRSYFKALY